MPNTVRVRAALVIVLAVFATLVSTAAVANASGDVTVNATCSGDRCTGLDPHATGCDSGSTRSDSQSTPWGTADLRWSPTCRTNWIRINLNQHVDRLDIVVWRTSDGKSAPYRNDDAGAGWHWGNMIYAPGCARGIVYINGTARATLQSSDCPPWV